MRVKDEEGEAGVGELRGIFYRGGYSPIPYA